MRHLSRSLLAMAVIGLSLSGVSSITQAEPLNYHLVELSAEAKRTISNDLLQATLYVEDSHGQAAELAQRLNRVADEALKKPNAIRRSKSAAKGRIHGRFTISVKSAAGAVGWSFGLKPPNTIKQRR